MAESDKLKLFNIEAFLRSEGVSSDIIFLDSVIINNENNVEIQAEQLRLLISNIQSREQG